jgi:hypothetical protein
VGGGGGGEAISTGTSTTSSSNTGGIISPPAYTKVPLAIIASSDKFIFFIIKLLNFLNRL